MKNSENKLKEQLLEIASAYKQGKNVMEIARKKYNEDNKNNSYSILLSYDLQAGTYNKQLKGSLSSFYDNWGKQLSEILNSYSHPNNSFLEIGCGECSTMVYVLKYLRNDYSKMYGFDISWSRIFEGNKIINEHQSKTNLFVADLFSIPLADNSIDIIYSSHSLEPNAGKEELAIRELLRVARDKVILFEPIYELANKEQQDRMDSHGYIKNLKDVSELFDVNILMYETVPIYSIELNRSGVIVLEKKNKKNIGSQNKALDQDIWQCPVTDQSIQRHQDLFFNEKVGLAYPILRGIPLLQKDHHIIASKITELI